MATIKIKQIKSKIGAPKDQKETLKVLGLHRIGEVVEREDNAVTRGTPFGNRSRITSKIARK